jgi:hypothetical protein
MQQTRRTSALCLFLGHRWAEWTYHSGEYATRSTSVHFHDSPTHRSRDCDRCQEREQEEVRFLDDRDLELLARRLSVRG